MDRGLSNLLNVLNLHLIFIYVYIYRNLNLCLDNVDTDLLKNISTVKDREALHYVTH